jgi:hypothetical protein
MIFADRSIPRNLVTALRAVQDDVGWLEPRFPHDTPGPASLAEAGKAGWLVITRDQRIRTRPFERSAIEEHSVGCFILAYRRPLKRSCILKLVTATLDEMERLFEETPRPFIFTESGDRQFRQYR